MNDIAYISIIPKKNASKLPLQAFVLLEKWQKVKITDREKFRKKTRNKRDRQISSYLFIFVPFSYMYLLIKIQAITVVLSNTIRVTKIILQKNYGSPFRQ